MLYRGGCNFFQIAIEPQPNSVRLFVGFEMDVRCALLDSIQQNLIHETYDGSVFDVIAAHRVLFEIVVAAGDLEVVEIEIVIVKRRHRRVDLLDCLVADALKLVLFDDDGFHGETRLELDLVERVEVSGIGYRDKQTFASFDEREDTMLVEELVRNQFDRVEFRLYGVQIQKRDAKFLRRGDRDFTGVGQTGTHQMGNQGGAILFCSRQCLNHGRFVEEAVLDQTQRQSLQNGALRAQRRDCVCHGLDSANESTGSRYQQLHTGPRGKLLNSHQFLLRSAASDAMAVTLPGISCRSMLSNLVPGTHRTLPECRARDLS